MASTEELIEQAKESLRAEFAAGIDAARNELGALIVEARTKADEVGVKVDELTATPPETPPAPPVDDSTKLLNARVRLYLDQLADRIGAPRMEGS